MPRALQPCSGYGKALGKSFQPPSAHIQDLFNAWELGTEAVMKRFPPPFAALAVLSVLAGGLLSMPEAARADAGGEQGEVRKERRAGNVRPLREIERQVIPRMNGMQYLGPEYDPAAMAYRLKFIQNGKVHFVDVDARTGRIIGQSR
ncbi:PepSY domain-containing protein [Novosphingobium silvae]